MLRRRVCLHVLGDPPPEVEAAFGNYVLWFERLWAEFAVEVVAVRGDAGGPLPDPRDYAGIVLSGSPASLTEPEPWMEGPVEVVRQAAQVGTPLLGVCFGHQVIGAAYGAGVIVNPTGWEVSTREVEVLDAGARDPLFSGLGPRLRVNLSHRDVVDGAMISPRNGLRALARNGATDAQALAAGDAIRGVQFHPEFDGAVTAAYVRARRDTLTAAGEDPDALLAAAADTPDAVRVFHNFTRHFILKA